MAKASSEGSAYRWIVLLSMVMIGLVVMVFCTASLWLRQTPKEIPFDPQSAHLGWQTEIQAVVDEVAQKPSADRLRTLREKLLQLRVTSEDRDVHLQFILALLALERGDANAESLFIQARDAALR